MIQVEVENCLSLIEISHDFCLDDKLPDVY